MNAFLFAILLHGAASADESFFREHVAPVLAQHCVSCHNPEKRSGGLSLETAEEAFTGGESGEVIVAADPDSSYLLDLVTPDDGKAEMPQGAAPISPDDLRALRQWIADGASWPEGLILSQPTWWSLRPLVKPSVPQGSADRDFLPRTPIDAFILDALQQHGLTPSPPADRRTLIRRLYFDLIGLPPTAEDVDSFVQDADPGAYEKLVDRLLNSQRYGERWARHWLDVVHYGETHGYDKDQPRPNAWPYRDYVIRAFNQDKRYGRFVQEQIAGDVLFPGTADGIEAMGFIAAGPWDQIGHAEVPETKFDGKVARHLDRDDMVQNTLTTFMSLTVGCAQCHDHKFDPISQEDYYSLHAVFAALDRADREYDPDPDLMRRRDEIQARRRLWTGRKKALDEQVRKAGGEDLAKINKAIADVEKNQASGPPQHGYHSAIVATPNESKWVQVDLEKAVAIERIVVVACHDDFNAIGAGFGFPQRFKIEVANDAALLRDVSIVTDRRSTDYANPGTTPQDFGVPGHVARYVRFTATHLAHRKDDYILALAELQVLTADGQNVARGKPVTAADSIEAPIRWAKQNLVDGIYPGRSPAADLAQLREQRADLLTRVLDAEKRQAIEEAEKELAETRKQLDQLPQPRRVYIGKVHHGSGNFRGTGPDDGRPRAIHVLQRGDVNSPGKAVAPGALACIEGLPARFELPANTPEQERRAALANWLVHRRNPLTWRSVVNRVWQYHMGRGLVETPDDFGRMGQLPTHPELLDWLAVEFRDGGQSLKNLHRQIVTSTVYRQSSNPASERARPNLAQDADNAFYWRMNRRHLEAEAVRDAILAAAGKLDLHMGGPSFQDFVIEKPQHSPHYQYHLHDPEDPSCHRRSIYRFLVRSQKHPFMTALDCADPSMMVSKRNQTITPLQALAMLNNQLVLSMTKHFAARVEESGGTDGDKARRAFRIALGRDPGDDELVVLAAHARKHGLANMCRVILNLNEFAFVD